MNHPINTFLTVFLGLFLFTNKASAQTPAPYRVKYNLVVDDGNRDGSKVNIERDGQKWKSRAGDEKGFLELDFGHDYVLSFSKEGYVTKKIFISTKNVPEEIQTQGLKPYVFDITIFKQIDGVNIVVFNQPVGRIVYNADIDDFNYDTDYTTSVLSGIQDAEKQLKQKKKTDKSKSKSDTLSTNKQIQAQQKEKPANPEEDKNAALAKKSKAVDTENDSRKRIAAATAEEERRRIAAQTEAELREKSAAKKLPEKREEKQFVDGNKRITEVTITRNGRTYVYRKVAYIWGMFYFRDNINITESSFIQEAL